MINSTKRLLLAFANDESGLSAVEYGLLAAGIAVGLWSYISSIGTSLHTIFGDVQTDLSAGAGSGS
jgi:pilus assembly protein Flp/PilA